MSAYLVPFSSLKDSIRLVSSKGQLKVDATYDELPEIISKLLMGVTVDEQWYMSQYPDVAEAISAGIYKGAKHHFVAHGYLEGRWPFPMQVDAEWYVREYPDVQTGIDSEDFGSAQEHFTRHGYAEGRRPGPM